MVTLTIKTLTPLWTGNYDRKSEFLKSTSIIGSLRWWFEAIIRGFGYYACDPTLNPCELKESVSDICLACNLFGCSGFRKQFLFRVGELDKTNLFFKTESNKWWLNRQYQNQDKVLWGECNIEIIGLNENAEELLSSLLLFIQNYGGIGAKTQNGFGQFIIKTQLNNEEENHLRRIYVILKHSESFKKNRNSNWYNFNDFFLLKYRINIEDPLINYFINKVNPLKKEPENWENNYIPCSFDLKYNCEFNKQQIGIKKVYKETHKFNKHFLNSIFGSKKSGSRIFFSHLFKENIEDNYYYLKIWGFIPEILLKNNKLILEVFQDEIDAHLRNNMFKYAELLTRETGKQLIVDVLKNEL